MAERRPKQKGRRPSLRLRDSFTNLETEDHHLAGPFRPQTPFDAQIDSPVRSPASPAGKLDPWSTQSEGLWADILSWRWVIVPRSSFAILLLGIVLYTNWELITPHVAPSVPNPFAPLLFISHRIPTSSPDDPRYAKGYLDLAFIAYYIVFWSWVRQVVTLHICWPIARWFGIKKHAKLARFGEQGYAIVYFSVMGAWGVYIMSQLPTWWYRTEYFWIDYPHWDMKPGLKAYYLMQAAYWCQQYIVLVLKLEKPRKDFAELTAHHLVTLWLIGWSYLINLTLIGNAVYLSMDVPDAFLAFSKIMNYIQYTRTKIISFLVFAGIWSYFRIWMNMVMLRSVWTEFDLMPETSKRWSPEDGVWLVWWMKYQIFTPILLLLFLNIFWYILILRIAFKAVTLDNKEAVRDERSDEEDDKDD